MISDLELLFRVRVIKNDDTGGQLSSQTNMDSETALSSWVHNLELAFQFSHIPRVQWSDAMTMFIEGTVKVKIGKRWQTRRAAGQLFWIWEEFLESLREVVGESGYTIIFRPQYRG